MTKAEFNRAFAIAQSDADLSNVDDEHLFGFGLPDFKKVVTTLRAVAKTIRWQAGQFNGEWNNEALQEIREFGRKRFEVIGNDNN